jgi:hypothetical protein
MSKGKYLFRESVVARAHRAAHKANLKNYILRITPAGALEFIVGQQEEPSPEDEGRPPNSFDQVLGTR